MNLTDEEIAEEVYKIQQEHPLLTWESCEMIFWHNVSKNKEDES